MHILGLGPEQLVRCLGAIKAVAVADGHFDDRERGLMVAAARALALDVDVDAMAPESAEALAAAVTDPEARHRVVQALIVTAVMDGQIKGAELDVIRDFARVLEVHERRLENLRQLLEGHFRYVQFDLMRRSEMVRAVVEDAYARKGLHGVWKTVAGAEGLAVDASEAARFAALGALPRGTLGREYFEHMSERGFPFPGQRQGFAAGFMKHDLCHVLGDYDTDPHGECEVVAFISGFMKTDPFGYLFMIAVHMNLGVEIFRGSETARLELDPGHVVLALKRGALVNRDLYDPSMDWWSHFETPLDALRERWNILPPERVLFA